MIGHPVLFVACALLALLWAFDTRRLRRRARALAVLAPGGDDAGGFRVIAAPGVTVPPAVAAAAAAHARREGLEALDLIPADLPVRRLLPLLATTDPASYRRARIAAGRGAGQALLASEALLARIGPPPADLFELAQRLKKYAATTTDLAVAPGLRAAPGRDLPTLRRTLTLMFGAEASAVIGVRLFFLALATAGAFASPLAGVAALAVAFLQPLLVTAGTALAPRDRVAATVLGVPGEVVHLHRLALAQPPPEPDPVAPLRPVYADLVAGGLDPFFEPRRDDCPLCGGRDLEVALETEDLLQHKPGRFVVERCTACKHLFQNPRLSIAGLEYYYRDFYDGLDESKLEVMFGMGSGPYLARARMVGAVARPTRWLDVGAGHGHFAAAAREVFPNVSFDGLDLSTSMAEAERRGWVGRGWHGLFPDLADRLAGEGYDVVSMSHYLEHTRDPAAELAAAARVLAPGSHLLIEVPDPECRLRHVLGRYWIPWLQPQHQHFLSVANLERLLRERGFEPVEWQRVDGNSGTNFLLAAYLLAQQLSPAADRPWRAPPSEQDRVLGQLVYWARLPLFLAAAVLDRVVAPLVRGPGWSNAYRVVARRVSEPGTRTAPPAS